MASAEVSRFKLLFEHPLDERNEVETSAWINGIVNNLTFSILEEAKNAKSVFYLIPMSFTITDEDFQQKVISTAEDKNKVNEKVQSETQYPSTYTFEGNEIWPDRYTRNLRHSWCRGGYEKLSERFEPHCKS